MRVYSVPSRLISATRFASRSALRRASFSLLFMKVSRLYAHIRRLFEDYKDSFSALLKNNINSAEMFYNAGCKSLAETSLLRLVTHKYY
jgi:hypothetical protein